MCMSFDIKVDLMCVISCVILVISHIQLHLGNQSSDGLRKAPSPSEIVLARVLFPLRRYALSGSHTFVEREAMMGLHATNAVTVLVLHALHLASFYRCGMTYDV